MKKFDLNIEKVLDNWETYHAVREVIANALDEQLLTKTKDIEIFQDKQRLWHIRDFGRGLRYEHLTQKENEEKLDHSNLIGKFGVGLKDALATFNRRGVKIHIKAKYGDITLDKSEKHDFEDIVTLHACIGWRGGYLPSRSTGVASAEEPTGVYNRAEILHRRPRARPRRNIHMSADPWPAPPPRPITAPASSSKASCRSFRDPRVRGSCGCSTASICSVVG